MSESRKKSRGVGFPATNRFVTIIAGFLDLPCLRSKSWPTVNLHFDPVRLSLVIPTLDQSGAEKQLTLLALNLPPERYRVEVIALNRGVLRGTLASSGNSRAHSGETLPH